MHFIFLILISLSLVFAKDKAEYEFFYNNHSSDFILWLDASNKESVEDKFGNTANQREFNGRVSVWRDISNSKHTHDFYSHKENTAPDYINKRQSLRFNGFDTRLGPNNHAELNTADVNQRNVSVVFRTSRDVRSRQMIWDGGGATRGMNIFISKGHLYCGFWNMPSLNEDGGQAPEFIKTKIRSNKKYVITWRFDYSNYPGFPNINQYTHTGTDPYNNIGISGTVDCFLNGKKFGTIEAKSALYSHGADIEIGWNGNTCWETASRSNEERTSCDNEPKGVEPFHGNIYEVLMFRSVPNNQKLRRLWRTLKKKWQF